MIDSLVESLARLDSACIDSSSLIVCNKAGILDPLAEICSLYTIQPVLEETGYHDAPVLLRAAPAAVAGVDDLLLAAAVETELPLISEDRALLLKAADNGLAYYNALMMLNLLLLRRSLLPRQYANHARLLRSATRYGAEVEALGQAVYLQILKQI